MKKFYVLSTARSRSRLSIEARARLIGFVKEPDHTVVVLDGQERTGMLPVGRVKLTGWLEEAAAEMALSLVVEGVTALTVKRGLGRKIAGTGSSGSGSGRCTKMGKSASGEEKEACGVKKETGLTGPRPRVQGERVRRRRAY